MPSEELIFVLLFGSAFIAGVMNSIAGGGTLLTFPALMYALGPAGAAIANATSTIALLPGSLAGTWGYRKELAETKKFALRMLPVSLAGGLLGALLLVWFPKSFRTLVPWLILLAAVLFLVQPMLLKFVKGRQQEPQGKPGISKITIILFFQFWVSVYGGYFGAGIGILMLSALGFMGLGDIHRLNSVKTFLAAAINGISVIVFIGDSLIHWNYAIIMAFASVIGGYIGANVARTLRPALVRWVVIVIAFTLAGYYMVNG